MAKIRSRYFAPGRNTPARNLKASMLRTNREINKKHGSSAFKKGRLSGTYRPSLMKKAMRSTDAML